METIARLFKIGNATRISLGLILIVLSSLGISYSFGFMPSHAKDHAKDQLELAKSLAIQFSAAIENHDAAHVQDLAGSIVGSIPEVASIGLRHADGKLAFATQRHQELWNQAGNTTKSGGLVPVDVQIYDRDKNWGKLELVFSGNVAVQREFMPLFLFITASCLLAFMLFMKRTLKVLDPSQVIPERVRAMLDTLTEGAAIVDGDGRIVLGNQSLAKILGVAAEKLLGVPLSELPWKISGGKATDENGRPVPLPWEDLSGMVDCRGRMVQLETAAGTRSMVINARSIVGTRDRVRGCVFTFDDVTRIEQKNQQLVEMIQQLGHAQERVQKQNEELQRLATRDALTGCLNRRAFHEQLASLFAMSQRQSQPLSAIMLDIDHFKSVNDTFGHARGDEVLRGVAEVLRTGVRGQDVVCRYGGEEFCVLMPSTSLEGAEQLGEKLRQAIAARRIADVPVTASIGVSCTTLGGASAQTMIDQADEALYNSKHTGRNRVTRFDRMDPTIVRVPSEGNENEPDAEEMIPIHAVRSLFAALGFRDPQTAQHSRRVSEMCVKVGATWLNPRELFIIETAALLHDVGKVGVPDAILLKPGPLTSEEWQLMREHDRMGVEILQTAFNCPQLSAIIAHHHARHEWIATRDIEGGFIPLCARLLAIADAFDAMTTHRPYRAAMPREKACAELRRCAGTQFDPTLVEHFIQVVNESASADAEQNADKLARTLRLTMEAEMLAGKLLERDLEATAAIARHLAQTAAALGSEEVTEQCEKITQTLDGDADAGKLVTQTKALLEIVSRGRN